MVSTVFLVVAAVLVPWTVFLGLSLPPKYDAGHWNLLGTGFDVALVCVLAYAAWAAWFGRQILASTAIVAGTLLMCDAWFDIITSIGHRDQWLTLLTGLGGELPLAVFFFWQGSSVQALAADLSRGGMQLRSPVLMPVGTRMIFHFGNLGEVAAHRVDGEPLSLLAERAAPRLADAAITDSHTVADVFARRYGRRIGEGLVQMVDQLREQLHHIG
jgi:hypothetical protein